MSYNAHRLSTCSKCNLFCANVQLGYFVKPLNPRALFHKTSKTSLHHVHRPAGLCKVIFIMFIVRFMKPRPAEFVTAQISIANLVLVLTTYLVIGKSKKLPC